MMVFPKVVGGYRSKKQQQLFKVSGRVKGNKLDSFLYLLMRDHLPTGIVASLVKEVDTEASKQTDFTNGYLAKYAKYLVGRLKS